MHIDITMKNHFFRNATCDFFTSMSTSEGSPSCILKAIGDRLWAELPRTYQQSTISGKKGCSNSEGKKWYEQLVAIKEKLMNCMWKKELRIQVVLKILYMIRLPWFMNFQYELSNFMSLERIVNGLWSEWDVTLSDVEGCFLPCNGTRRRTCSEPPPSNGGDECPNGEAVVIPDRCKALSCPGNLFDIWKLEDLVFSDNFVKI